MLDFIGDAKPSGLKHPHDRAGSHDNQKRVVAAQDDLAEASLLCDRCAILNAGTILQNEPVSDVLRIALTEQMRRRAAALNFPCSARHSSGDPFFEWRNCYVEQALELPIMYLRRAQTGRTDHVDTSSFSSNPVVSDDGWRFLACPCPNPGGACSQASNGRLFASPGRQIHARRYRRQGDERRQGRLPRCRQQRPSQGTEVGSGSPGCPLSGRPTLARTRRAIQARSCARLSARASSLMPIRRLHMISPGVPAAGCSGRLSSHSFSRQVAINSQISPPACHA